MLDNIDKSTPILLYCSIGYRSEKVGEKILKMGFKDVTNLYGSIFAWANAGYELKNAKGETTNQIHTYNNEWAKWILNPKLIKVTKP
jgi:3-mercaptopyruvate sulfurtransferase SseA